MTKDGNLISNLQAAGWALQRQRHSRLTDTHVAGEITTITAANHPKCQKMVLDEFLLGLAVLQGDTDRDGG